MLCGADMVIGIEESALIDDVIEFQLFVSKYDRICQMDNASDDGSAE